MTQESYSANKPFKKETELKGETEDEWMEIGFQGIIFKIPKEYNHQLVKEAEILIKQTKQQTLQEVEKMIDEIIEVKTEERVLQEKI